MRYPEAVEELIEYFRRLPGVGRRSAERMALAVAEWDHDEQRLFGLSVARLPEKVGQCPECGALADAGKVCQICSDPRRDGSVLCVVEDLPQLFAVEKGNIFRGKYLVLGGRLSPLDGEDGSGLNLELLKKRASAPEVKELILALSPDVEDQLYSCDGWQKNHGMVR